jgi:hypothetical protein
MLQQGAGLYGRIIHAPLFTPRSVGKLRFTSVLSTGTRDWHSTGFPLFPQLTEFSTVAPGDSHCYRAPLH